MNDQTALLISIFSAIATALAAFAAWRAPMSAAKLAEKLRRDGEQGAERQKQKMYVFSLLMQERAEIYSDNGVRALNLIDIVFNESREVRNAWSELYGAFEMRPLVQHLIDERLRRLLSAMAQDIGLSDQLRNDDLGRVYFPLVQQQNQFIRDMQRQQAFANLQGQGAAGAAAAVNPDALRPPRP
jgi:hypothetical protein